MNLSERIQMLIDKHGSHRAAARVLRVDDAYLWRLYVGEKCNPSNKMLRKLGLRRITTYELVRRQRVATKAK